MNGKKIVIEPTSNLNSALFSEWLKLWNNSNQSNIFNSPKWLKTIADKNLQPNIITARYKGNLVGIIPLIRQKIKGVWAWGDPGSSIIGKSSLLAKDELTTKLLIKYLMKLDNFYLTEINDDSIHTFLNTPGVKVRQISNSPVIRVNENISAKANKIKNDDYLLKTYFGPGSAGVIDKLAKSDTDFISEKENLSLLKKAIKKNGASARLDVLFRNESPLGFAIGFVIKNSLFGYKAIFKNNDKSKYPGKIFLSILIKDLNENKFDIFEPHTGIKQLAKSYAKVNRIRYVAYYSRNPLLLDWWSLENSISQFIRQKGDIYSIYSKMRAATQI